jgi:hypothetical protein
MSLSGCFWPRISIGIMMNFRFMQSHLYSKRTLCIYIESQAKCCGYCSFHWKDPCHPYSKQTLCSRIQCKVWVSSIYFLHWDPLAGCLNNVSCFCSSLCHRINLAWSLFLNRCFKRGIIGEVPHDLGMNSLPRSGLLQGRLSWSYTSMHRKRVCIWT